MSDVLLPHHRVEPPKAAGQTYHKLQWHQQPAHFPITAGSPAPPDPRTFGRAAKGFSQPWPMGKRRAVEITKHTLGRAGKPRMAAHLGTLQAIRLSANLGHLGNPGSADGQSCTGTGYFLHLYRTLWSADTSCTHQRLSMP